MKNWNGLINTYTAWDYRSQGSIVGIATGYGLDNLWVGVRVPVGSRVFLFPKLPRPAVGSYPTGTGDSFPGAKVAGA
jgi:hypothetical protein